MFFYSIAFLIGVLLLQNFSELPNENWVWISIVASIILSFSRKFRLLAAFALGFGWCLLYVHWQTSWEIPEDLEGKNVIVTGYVFSIPAKEQNRLTFLFKIKKLEFNNIIYPAQGLLRLGWQTNIKDFHVGDDWSLTVRLKKVHGMLNPGGFDYEAWALQEGIRANGYVVNRAQQKFLNSHWYQATLNRIREYLKEQIETNLPQSNTSPWIVALTLGERQGIKEENWEVLRNTGTNHLMAIAGLHIGFMSGFAYAIVVWAWRRSQRLVLHMPAQHAGAIGSLLMALIYSAMAGFSIPTQRASIMLIVFLIIVLLRRKPISWYAWSMALFIVLLLNPLSVLTESFWLSFGAVAFIIYGVSGRLAPTGLWWRLGRIQWVIACGLIPFSLWLFQQCSIVSFAANSIAIPWVGFFVVPLCLLGTFLLLFSAKLGGAVLLLSDKLLSWLWIILTWFAHLSWGSWYQVMPNYWILSAACIGMIILLAPAGFPGRYLGCIWLLPLIFYQVPKPKLGDLWLTTLDVGQGLSIIAQTKNHFLIFDAGPKLGPNFDMGESVVVPFLRAAGAQSIDLLIISHGDNDHIGGAESIIKRLLVTAIKTSVPEQLPTSHTTYCLRGEAWDWDNVKFKFLYPSQENLGLGNDSSCVLQITVGDKHILLTGDIEKQAETILVQSELKNLKADILVAPHHGSKTSAQDDFLEAVRPQYVIFSLGYRNRYHFPHFSVIKKYEALKVKKNDTTRGGAIKFILKAKSSISEPSLYRLIHHRYWNN